MLAGVTQSLVLEEVHRAQEGHERNQVVLEDGLVHLSIHCCILG